MRVASNQIKSNQTIWIHLVGKKCLNSQCWGNTRTIQPRWGTLILAFRQSWLKKLVKLLAAKHGSSHRPGLNFPKLVRLWLGDTFGLHHFYWLLADADGLRPSFQPVPPWLQQSFLGTASTRPFGQSFLISQICGTSCLAGSAGTAFLFSEVFWTLEDLKRQ